MSIKTKQMIAETFLAMTEHTNIDKITVKSLIETCDISRQTFYYHFQDILDVIEWCIQQSVQKTLERSLEADSPEGAIREFIAVAFKGYPLIDKLRCSQKWDQTEAMFLQGIRTYLWELVRHKAPQFHLRFSDQEVAMDFYTYGIAGLALTYAGKKQRDVDQLSRQICELLTGEDKR